MPWLCLLGMAARYCSHSRAVHMNPRSTAATTCMALERGRALNVFGSNVVPCSPPSCTVLEWSLSGPFGNDQGWGRYDFTPTLLFELFPFSALEYKFRAGRLQWSATTPRLLPTFLLVISRFRVDGLVFFLLPCRIHNSQPALRGMQRFVNVNSVQVPSILHSPDISCLVDQVHFYV